MNNRVHSIYRRTGAGNQKPWYQRYTFQMDDKKQYQHNSVVRDATQQFADILSDAFNKIQSVLDETSDITRCKKKYKFVKYFSKCKCCNRPIRTVTRHTWFARSNI